MVGVSLMVISLFKQIPAFLPGEKKQVKYETVNNVIGKSKKLQEET